MNDDKQDVQDEAMDRRLDAALGEVLGGEAAPDVTARVLARAAAGERIAAPDFAPERPDGGLLRQLPRPAAAPMRRLRFAAAVVPPTGFAGFAHQRTQPFDVSRAEAELGFVATHGLMSSFLAAGRFAGPAD